MDIVALVSGGKDSYLSLLHCISNGHRVVAIANLHPPTTSPVSSSEDYITTHLPAPLPTAPITLETSQDGNEDLDSFMYQTVGHQVLPLYATLLNTPLYRRAIVGKTQNQDLQYTPTREDETEDLYALLKHVVKTHPTIRGVCSGAILSTYQRTRVENVCARLGLQSLAPLWERGQLSILSELGSVGIDARTIKVAAVGLGEKWLWKNVGDVGTRRLLAALRDKWGVHPAGEGGEYETLVVDGPGFRGRLECEVETGMVGDVGFVKVKRVSIVDKGGDGLGSLKPEDTGITKTDILEKRFRKIVDRIGELSSAVTINHIPDLDPTPPTFTAPPPQTAYSSPYHTVYSNLPLNPTSAPSSLIPSFPHPSTITATALHLPTMSLFPTFHPFYKTLFPTSPPPRVCISPGEHLTQTALLSLTTIKEPLKRSSTLHIQSHSDWAPACIGPYAQAASTDLGVELAGQIGLVPRTGQVYSGDAETEIALALQNLVRVGRRMAGLEISDPFVDPGANHSDHDDADDADDEEEEEEEADPLPPFKCAVAYLTSPALLAPAAAIWTNSYPTTPLILAQAHALPRSARIEFHAHLPSPRVSVRDVLSAADGGAEEDWEECGEVTVFVGCCAEREGRLEGRVEACRGRVVRCERVWVVGGGEGEVKEVRGAGWGRVVAGEEVDGDDDDDDEEEE